MSFLTVAVLNKYSSVKLHRNIKKLYILDDECYFVRSSDHKTKWIVIIIITFNDSIGL